MGTTCRIEAAPRAAFAAGAGGVNARTSPALADRVALELAHAPSACEPLARRLEARTVDVRRVLRDDPRFERVGAGRNSRWQLAPGYKPHGTDLDGPGDGLGRVSTLGLGSEPIPALLAHL